ncbi:MAG: glycosyltransferase family 4 protein, partial [Actinobacteria bacterium]|nr:glycosyltransferase family 4 protein [Actinomycetota bacterium]
DKSKIPLKIKRYLSLKNIDKSYNVFHSSYYRYAKGNIKNVITVYDFMYEKYLNKYNFKRTIHGLQKYLAIKHSDYIIGISKNTLEDMLKHFPEFKNKKMCVVYLGISDDFYPIKNKNNSIKIKNQELFYNSYFFYFGNRRGYKNFGLLIKAYSNLMKNNKNIPKLIVAGGGSFNKEEMKLLREKEVLSNITKLKEIDNNELNLLYNYCSGFIYPSLYEGFGMPVLEAMQAGAPVICSNSSSIPEVAGEAAILVDPTDFFALEKSLFELFNNNTRKDLIYLGYMQSRKFSWDKMYKETLKIYNFL